MTAAEYNKSRKIDVQFPTAIEAACTEWDLQDALYEEREDELDEMFEDHSINVD